MGDELGHGAGARVVSEIYELRQYTLHPGRRDTLIELFEREFIRGQEEAGMRLPGTFVDLDDPDRFVWLRAFADMEQRREALTRFYGGPVWQTHRNTANATMIDSDDVLLLRLVNDRHPLPTRLEGGVLDLTVYERDEAFPLDRLAMPLLRSEPAENTFPALPVRTGEDVVISFSIERLPLLVQQRLRLAPTAKSAMR
jgi:hypothetical protein